ncbi:YihY/virulence factor BrkB family protein [Aliifodinibius salicampi]|uniref:YihY/virulence factor BrkB family protein n=1 Tax=Fodinibius salicampi TaxID=1920655 RepID=A0ABT3PW95_9BACT|nr:YihY/virulence factor BrkB family protein [Fodinibius salicampi]MCW9712125.1 YihY/virulence factor BrkB family protein [Fodinibius salicampi]
MRKTRWFCSLLKQALVELQKNDPLRLSSSTAFFAMFSLIPIIVLLLEFLGIAIQIQPLKEEIFNTLQEILGGEAANYLADTLANIQNMQEGFFTTAGLLIFLVFIVTTLFNVVHNSFNQILKVKLKDPSLHFFLKNRGLFLVIIFVGGMLLLASFIIDVIINFAGNHIFYLINIHSTIVFILDMIFSMALFTTWLAIVYKYLPDMKLPWRPVWIGSFITTVLAFIGQFILGKIIAMGNLNSIYGSSASTILVLLFIFYASFLLYYGICLIKIYAEENNYDLESIKYAVQYEIKEIE